MARKQDIFINNMKSKEIDLKEYYEVIKTRFWIIVATTVITTLAGYFYSQLTNNFIPLYQSSTRIIISADSENMKTLMVMIKDPTIMERVKDELNSTQSVEAIANQIEVSRVDDSRVIKISVINMDPNMAVSIANMTAQVFKSEIAEILNFHDVQLLSAAKENLTPINEPNNLSLKIAVIFGIVFGIGLVFLLDSLDETIKRENDVEDSLGVPVIGVVSNMNKRKLIVEKNKLPKIELRSGTFDIK